MLAGRWCGGPRSAIDGDGRENGDCGGGGVAADTLAPPLCRLELGLKGLRKSRAEVGGGGRGPRPGVVVGTEGNVGDEGRSVGTEGNASSRSFNSSIEGKACANSDSVRVGCTACRDELDKALDVDADGAKSYVRGEEPVDDVGDGGPKDAVDTKVWGEECVEGDNGGDDTA